MYVSEIDGWTYPILKSRWKRTNIYKYKSDLKKIKYSHISNEIVVNTALIPFGPDKPGKPGMPSGPLGPGIPFSPRGPGIPLINVPRKPSPGSPYDRNKIISQEQK